MPATSTLYTPGDKMIRLIADNYSLIQVMSRFGIRMGFADMTVEEVCKAQGVDCATFLGVVNFVASSSLPDVDSISIRALLHYLKQSHIYFLDHCLPALRRKILDGIHISTSDISFLILKFFDDYTSEVSRHMMQEEEKLFIYVDRLLSGVVPDDYTAATYSSHHEEVSSKLRELKRLIIQYCPESSDTNLLNDALCDIYRCEDELRSHCLVEDSILTPAIMRLEQDVESQSNKEARR